MRIRTNDLAVFAVTLAVAMLAAAEPSFAQGGGGVFDTIKEKAKDLFTNVRDVIFILGGFGLVGLALGAIFGRVNWKWFGGLAFGLVIIAVAGAVVEYLTGGTTGVADTLN